MKPENTKVKQNEKKKKKKGKKKSTWVLPEREAE